MTVQGRVALRNGLLGFLREIRGDLKDNALEAAREAGEAGRDSMRHTIETTPSGLSPGKPNRILTGHMWDRTDYRVTQAGNTTRVQIGWMNVKNAEKYFEAQEKGLGPVQGAMHALTKAQMEAQRVLKDKGFG